MKLPTEVFGEVIVIHAPEEIGEDTAHQLEEFLTSQERCKVILEMDGTETLDSVGLTSLLIAHEILRDQHGDLRISTNNKVNRKIFEITRLDQQLEIFESVLDAVRSFA